MPEHGAREDVEAAMYVDDDDIRDAINTIVDLRREVRRLRRALRASVKKGNPK